MSLKLSHAAFTPEPQSPDGLSYAVLITNPWAMWAGGGSSTQTLREPESPLLLIAAPPGPWSCQSLSEKRALEGACVPPKSEDMLPEVGTVINV